MYMRETDRNGTERWEELLRSLCRDSQVNLQFQTVQNLDSRSSGSRREGNCKRWKRGNQFSAFLSRGLVTTMGSFVPTRMPSFYMHKCVHTCLSWLQPTSAYARMEIAVSQFKELLESVTLHRMITAFVAVAARRKEDFETQHFVRIRQGFAANTQCTYLCVYETFGQPVISARIIRQMDMHK